MNLLLTKGPRSAGLDPTAPPRLADGGGSEQERRLVLSARFDGVPDGAAARVAAALSGAFVTPPGAAPSGAFAVEPGRFAVTGGLRAGKHWLGGLLGMSLFGAVVAHQWSAGPAGSEPASSPLAADVPRFVFPAVEALPVPARPPLEPGFAEVSSPPAAVAPSHRASDAKSDPPPRRARRRASATAPHDGLLEEVRALEAVQASLTARRAGEASRELERYHRRFPQGELALEAEVLGIDLMMARGERRRAAERARTLLEQPAADRYRTRLRALLEAAVTVDRPTSPANGSIGGGAHIREPR